MRNAIAIIEFLGFLVGALFMGALAALGLIFLLH
jgi:hypothetical protein